jgi:hypothetical protein
MTGIVIVVAPSEPVRTPHETLSREPQFETECAGSMCADTKEVSELGRTAVPGSDRVCEPAQSRRPLGPTDANEKNPEAAIDDCSSSCKKLKS